jgi:hypothetical protein
VTATVTCTKWCRRWSSGRERRARSSGLVRTSHRVGRIGTGPSCRWEVPSLSSRISHRAQTAAEAGRRRLSARFRSSGPRPGSPPSREQRRATDRLASLCYTRLWRAGSSSTRRDRRVSRRMVGRPRPTPSIMARSRRSGVVPGEPRLLSRSPSGAGFDEVAKRLQRGRLRRARYGRRPDGEPHIGWGRALLRRHVPEGDRPTAPGPHPAHGGVGGRATNAGRRGSSSACRRRQRFVCFAQIRAGGVRIRRRTWPRSSTA